MVAGERKGVLEGGALHAGAGRNLRGNADAKTKVLCTSKAALQPYESHVTGERVDHAHGKIFFAKLLPACRIDGQLVFSCWSFNRGIPVSCPSGSARRGACGLRVPFLTCDSLGYPPFCRDEDLKRLWCATCVACRSFEEPFNLPSFQNNWTSVVCCLLLVVQTWSGRIVAAACHFARKRTPDEYNQIFKPWLLHDFFLHRNV